MFTEIVKSELKYNSPILILFGSPFPLYTICVLADFQLLSGPMWDIDYWGGIYSLIIYMLLFIFWGIQLLENIDQIPGS